MASASPTFSTLLRQLRKRAGMTQSALAAAIGYSISFISDLEQNRRRPTVEVVLQQLIPALGLQAAEPLAAHLIELAALARGERAPPTITLQHTTQLVVTETFAIQPSHLPAPPTALIGREQAIKTLCNRLQGHSGRLLTLVGPPGVGKTRLALAVASQLEPLFNDGARFVPLATVTDPELVATVIANDLELVDTGKQSPQMRLIQGLQHKALLLVLDNFEQIIAAAPLLATLLAACAGLYLLVTSRERLHLRAEQRYSVPPLKVAAAVELFVKRSQAVEPDFALTADNQTVIHQLCRRLDYLPLAIELLAARVDVYTPQALLTRLQHRSLDLLVDGPQDLPIAHRTLRRAIHQSYILLVEPEQALFRTLGVFAGGFDLAAVVYFGFAEAELQTLLHKNLIRVEVRTDGTQRFLLLETLRDYAREQLTAHQEADLAQRQHAAYYLQLAEAAEPQLSGTQAGAWLGNLETEHNNLRTALTLSLAIGDTTTALRLCGALRPFWAWHGHAREAKNWLEKTLGASADAPLAVRAKALSAAGQIEHILGNHGQAQTWVEQSLALYQTVNDRQKVAAISLQLAGIFRKQHRYVEAQRYYEQGFKLFQALEAPWHIAQAHLGLGSLAMNQGDYAQAKAQFEQALVGQRTLGDKLGITETLPRLAMLAFQQGEYPRALLYCEELLALAQELGDQESVANALNELGRIALYQGQFAQATRYLTESFALAQALGYLPILTLNLTYQGNLALAQADWAQAHQCYGQSLRLAYQLTEKLDIATGLESLAGVAGMQQAAARTSQLLGAAASLRALIGVPLPAHEQQRYQQLMTTARAKLDESTYASAYAAGYAMTVDQAVAFALAQVDTQKNDVPQA